MLKKIAVAVLFLMCVPAFSDDWVVCMGSFKSYDNALERLHLLSEADIPVFIAEHKKNEDETLFRVIYSDYFYTAKEALNACNRLLTKNIVKELNLFDLWCCKKSDLVLSPALQ